ncbi:MAG: HAD family phosphatase [Bacteroidales bacterium]|nr:HAD family phosphatase [Bacteroidales bacterium]
MKFFKISQSHDLGVMVDIKNIIFDFGGVIINISHQRVESAFKALGIANFEVLFNQATQSNLFQQFEKGEITAKQFRNNIRKLTHLDISDDKLDEAWNQIIGEYPPGRIDLLKHIKNNYRLFLLSNTNIIHFEFYIPKFESEFGFSFQSLFEHTYWSFECGKRKPDQAPYNQLILENHLVPEETLFIDDSVQNIMAAKKAGLKTIHLTNNLDITKLFKDGKLIQTFLV